ncbi:unnamed protein product [Adineta steineri]|uniref:C2 domain-containing protein n=1 Tax=Adineta steineri TaxID=433720 RepID=A0A814YFJ3_9BILA|nr:unnamed protein product [Adineta steineri]CAF1259267.1 unnamed protein product [Adineta steineri]CAF1521260.1 unnamed protein product [Adineta steineri]CAF1547338.1 unnamed protein product [Adineta steineri]
MSSSHRLKGLLSITVLKANNLIKGDWLGENDCYAVLSLEPLPLQSIGDLRNKDRQTEIAQMTQIHDGSNPVFNEKLIFPVADKLDMLYVQLWDADPGKDDLLGHGTLSLLDDDQGGQFDTNTKKEWLYTTTISLTTEKGKQGGTVEIVLHFIPETVAAYMEKRFDAAQAELKKKLTQQIVAKVTGTASSQIQGFMGIGN